MSTTSSVSPVIWIWLGSALDARSSGIETYEACDVLMVEVVTIETGATIVFRANTVILADNVVVEGDASLTVLNSAPASCPP